MDSVAEFYNTSAPADEYTTVQAMLKTKKIDDWLFDPGCKKILIQFPAFESQVGKTGFSPLSKLCVDMLKKMRKSPRVFHLAFFCGIDRVERKELGIFLVASLTVQLLAQMPNEDLDSDLPLVDLESLCRIFSGLLKQLPEKSAIVCILDDVSVEHENSKDIGTVLEYLLTQPSDGSKWPVTKLLLTSPRKYTGSPHTFDPNEPGQTLLEPGDVDPKRKASDFSVLYAAFCQTLV